MRSREAASTFARFGATSGSASNLENPPHGGVHIWCGDTTLQSAGADMGLLDTAAQGPLFWAHHANIDRLWSVWLGASASHKNPTSSPWLKHKFTFWDERKRWVSITVADVINISNNLRYTYGMVAAPEVTRSPIVTELTVDSGGAIRLPAAMTNTLLGSQGNRSKTTTLRLARVMLPPGRPASIASWPTRRLQSPRLTSPRPRMTSGMSPSCRKPSKTSKLTATPI